MFSIRSFFFPVVVISALALGGCSTPKVFDQGFDQRVTLYSFPPGAKVSVNGEALGRTPVSVELPRRVNHTVRLEKHGYKVYEGDLAPTPNGKGDAFIRFGLMQDFGMYEDLEPNPIAIQMQPDVLPDWAGPDPYTEMAAIILKVDGEHEAGFIGPIEHKYKVAKVIEFYSN